MIVASISGRAAFDPRVIQTKSKKAMTTIRLACSDVEGDTTLWLDLVAFGSKAEWLSRAAKGDRIAAMGNIKMNSWTDKGTGEIRETMQMVADNLIVPAPKPKKAKPTTDPPQQKRRPPLPDVPAKRMTATAALDYPPSDDIPF